MSSKEQCGNCSNIAPHTCPICINRNTRVVRDALEMLRTVGRDDLSDEVANMALEALHQLTNPRGPTEDTEDLVCMWCGMTRDAHGTKTGKCDIDNNRVFTPEGGAIQRWKAQPAAARERATEVLHMRAKELEFSMLDSPNEVNTSHLIDAAEALKELVE